MIPDVLADLRSILIADSGVNALVAGRVFVGELPAAQAASMPRKCLVIKDAGGPESNSFLTLHSQRFDAFCYGETPYEANKVRRAVYSSLKSLSRRAQGESLIHSVMVSGGANFLRDPDTDWPMRVQSFLALASDVVLT